MADHSTLTASRLPVELWKIVFGYVPPTAARSCLSLSHLFHDLAAPQLFATIRIHFGSWKGAYGMDTAMSPKESTRAYELSRTLLENISADAVFASYIKHIHVLAFLSGDQVSITGRVVEAIRSTRNLHSFRWYTAGSPPWVVPSAALLQTLSDRCPKLRECTLPFQCMHTIELSERMSTTDLSLYTSRQFQYPASLSIELPHEQHTGFLSQLLTLHAGHPLTHLTILGSMVWEMPTDALQHLTHLGLRQAKGLKNVTVLFDHCVRLESLWIRSRDVNDSAEAPSLLTALGEHPNALPHLTHLKLSLGAPNDDGAATELHKLAAFLAPKKKLRCLDWSEPWGGIDELSPLLGVLCLLPQLEILGLDITCGGGNASEILESGELNRYIPKSLTALRLWVDYFDSNPPIVSASLNALLSGLTQLAFLWLDDPRANPLADSLEVAESAPSLQLFGHRDDFFEVYHGSKGVVLDEPWSSAKAVFRSVDDVGSADWYWLMQGHSNLIREQIVRRSAMAHSDCEGNRCADQSQSHEHVY